MHSERFTYTVVGKKREAPGVTTLSFTNGNGEYAFIPGQYLTIYLPNSDTPEGKAYSISSAPHESIMEMTVRDIGTFSHHLATREAGDSFEGSLPYGFFSPENDESDLVMIAGGIGITPFRSMLRDAQMRTPKRRVQLFHGVRSLSDAVFRDELCELTASLPGSSYHQFISREKVEEDERLHSGRVSGERILSLTEPSPNTEFLICGSIGFTRDIWRALKNAGVDQDRLYTEAFFSHM